MSNDLKFDDLTMDQKRLIITTMIERRELVVTLDVGDDDPFYVPTETTVMPGAVLLWCDPAQKGIEYSDNGFELIPFTD